MAKSGIYEITNTINGHRYVGSAVDLPKRKRNHWCMLRGMRHFNRYLQNAWNKYSEDAFRFKVIEHWEPEFLISFEQWWMNMLQPEYNICKVAGSRLGVQFTDEHKAKIGAANKGQGLGRELSDSHRAKLSASMMGNQHALGHKQSASHRAKISAANKGYKHTTEARSNMSVATMGNQRALGHKHTDEARANMSAAQQRRRATEAKKTAKAKQW